MAVNRFYQGTPYQASLYTPPVEFVAKALEAVQKQYDVNFAAAEELRNKYIQSMPVDRARANEIQKGFQTKIDDIVAKYNGDYSQASTELYTLKKEIGRQFGPGGEAEAIQKRYTAVQDSLKRAREASAKGKVNSSEVTLLENFYAKQGPTTYDPTTQTYSQPQIIELPESYDVNKAFREYLKTVPKRTKEVKIYTGKKTIDGYLEFKTEKREWIDPKEVSLGWKALLDSDPMYKNWAGTMETLVGVPSGKLTDEITTQYDQSVIPSQTGVINQSTLYDYKDDWKQKAFTEDMYARRRMLMKQQMDNPPANLTPSKLFLSQSTTPQYPELPLETTSGWKFAETGNVGDLFNRGTQRMTYARAMSDSSLNVNKALLKSLKEENPNATDDQLLNMYNNSVREIQYASGINYARFETTDAQEEEANRLLPLLKSNVVRMWEITPDGKQKEVVGEDRKTLGMAFADPNKPTASKVRALGKAYGYSGHVPSGSTILEDPTGGKNIYVVADPRVDIARTNKIMDSAFSFMRKGQDIGDYFEVLGPNGKGFGLVGTMNYAKGHPLPIYYTARYVDGKLQINYNDPVLTEDNVYASPYDIEMMLMPQDIWTSIFPRKTSAALENEISF